MSSIKITPLTPPPGSVVNFGAVVDNIDVENLSDDDFDALSTSLYEKQVLILKHQSHVTPQAQYALTRRFDPASMTYGHGAPDTASRGAKSILHPDLKTVPHTPQVQVLGHGFVPEIEGLRDVTLRHPHHKTFHRDPLPEEKDEKFTRFYRWHIDAALYGGLYPPKVTTLMAVRVPKGRRQTVLYDDGSGDELDVSLGTTAFVSGEQMYDRLNDEEKNFARSTRVEYAPHPYIWMSRARSLPTGLGLYTEGRELPESELPPTDPSLIQTLPMVWPNPVTGRLAFQVHPSAAHKLYLSDGSVIDDLSKVRDIVYRLQRPAIAPRFVYAHEWEEGDMVLFHNRGVLHSVVGAFLEGEVRVFRQCNLAASEGVKGQ